jgi:hypothetical protein
MKLSDEGKNCIKICTSLSDSEAPEMLPDRADTVILYLKKQKDTVSGKICIDTYFYRIMYKYVKLQQSRCKMSMKTSK